MGGCVCTFWRKDRGFDTNLQDYQELLLPDSEKLKNIHLSENSTSLPILRRFSAVPFSKDTVKQPNGISIQMAEDALALACSDTVGDTNEIIDKIHVLKSVSKNYQDFQNRIESFPTANTLWQNIVQQTTHIPQNKNSVSYLYYSSNTIKERMYHLQQHPNANTSIFQDELQLLQFQNELSSQLQLPLFDTSIANTFISLVETCHLTQATEMSKKFNMSSKHVWHLLLIGLTSSGQLDMLHQLALDTTPPIGYKPINDAFQAANRTDLLLSIP